MKPIKGEQTQPPPSYLAWPATCAGQVNDADGGNAEEGEGTDERPDALLTSPQVCSPLCFFSFSSLFQGCKYWKMQTLQPPGESAFVSSEEIGKKRNNKKRKNMKEKRGTRKRERIWKKKEEIVKDQRLLNFKR
jgi:hypothetical protein